MNDVPTVKWVQGKWFVATYGDFGLNVEFFTDPLAYGRATRKAKADHDNGDVDTYTYGDCTVMEVAGRDQVPGIAHSARN